MLTGSRRDPALPRAARRHRRLRSARAAPSCPFYDALMDSTAHPPHPGAPRAGRRPRGRRLRLGDPTRSASRSRPPAPARPTSSPRSPTPTWTRCRSLAITGQVFSTSMGTDAFQEADIVGITMPITKHSFLVTRPEDIPGDARRGVPDRRRPAAPAPCSSTSRRTRSRTTAPFIWPPKIDLPGYRPVTKAHGKQIQAAAQLLAEAKKPVLYVGGGVIRAAGLGRAARRSPRRPARRSSRRSWRAARSPTRTRSTSACPACTARFPRCSRCRRPTCSSRSAPASTTA